MEFLLGLASRLGLTLIGIAALLVWLAYMVTRP